MDVDRVQDIPVIIVAKYFRETPKGEVNNFQNILLNPQDASDVCSHALMQWVIMILMVAVVVSPEKCQEVRDCNFFPFFSSYDSQ